MWTDSVQNNFFGLKIFVCNQIIIKKKLLIKKITDLQR